MQKEIIKQENQDQFLKIIEKKYGEGFTKLTILRFEEVNRVLSEDNNIVDKYSYHKSFLTKLDKILNSDYEFNKAYSEDKIISNWVNSFFNQRSI